MIFLEGQGLTSGADNGTLNSRSSKEVVLVGNAGKGTLRSGVLAITEVVVPSDSVSVISGVEGLLAALPHVALDQHLGALTGVDAVADVQVVVVVKVACTEAEGGTARVQVVQVVVVDGDAEVAGVFVAVAVGVAVQHGLPVVVDKGVGDGYVVGGVGELYCFPSVSWVDSFDEGLRYMI